MDIYNSAGVVNRIKLRSIIVAGLICLVIVITTLGVALIPLGILWVISFLIAKREIDALARDATSFKKNFPLRAFGVSYGEFIHTFYHDGQIELQIMAAIETDLRARTPVDGLRNITITDIDKDLRSSEVRSFKAASAAGTSRGTQVTLILRYSVFGGMQSIKWWALAGGYIDRDKKFNFITYAPITIWFWFIPYLNRSYDVVSRLRTIYGSTYNTLDIETQVRSLHDVVFGALIGELERNGIDTSDLKVQRMQMMNINISGGNVNMGNVIQGAMNKVISGAGGGGA